jgi:type IV secretion system protein VirB5
MRHLLLTAAAVTTLGFASPALAQGVPTFDGSQLGQLVAQLEHMAEDLNVQMQQLATMRLELETQLSQLTNLEAQLTSLIEGSGLGELFATVEEFRALRGKLVAPLNTAQSLASGDFLSGFNPGAELSASVASAGASAMLSVAAQESHEEAGQSLERLETMVGLIDDQDGLKAAVDLNTRVTAELGIILTQIWRLEAAQGVSAGQLGVVDAATLADERKFRSMAVDP